MIFVVGLFVGKVIGVIANDVALNVLFDPAAGRVNREAALQAAAIGTVAKISVWGYSFYLAVKQYRTKQKNLPASVDVSDARRESPTARIARTVEAELLTAIKTLGPIYLSNYRTMYAWGTEGGNYIFDQVQKRTAQKGLGEADRYIMALMYMALQARADENELMVVAFKSIIAEAMQRIGKHLSLEVFVEVSKIDIFDTELLLDIEMSKRKQEHSVAEERQPSLAPATEEMNDSLIGHEPFDSPSVAERSNAIEATSARRFSKAWKVIDYSDAAAAAWEDIKSLPEEYQQRFLASLDQEPALDVGPLAAQIIADRAKELRPYDDNSANDALEQARTISLEAEQEFLEVYDMLGSSLAPSEILKKVESKFGPSAETISERERQRREAERKAAVQRLSEEERRRRKAERKAKDKRISHAVNFLAITIALGIWAVFLLFSSMGLTEAFGLSLMIAVPIWLILKGLTG